MKAAGVNFDLHLGLSDSPDCRVFQLIDHLLVYFAFRACKLIKETRKLAFN